MTESQAKAKATELTRGKTTALVGSWITNGVRKHVVHVTHAPDMEDRPQAYTIS